VRATKGHGAIKVAGDAATLPEPLAFTKEYFDEIKTLRSHMFKLHNGLSGGIAFLLIRFFESNA
jgi:hypothetical protein